jgi:glycosyltransferase involved in cell wall biosynthesis
MLSSLMRHYGGFRERPPIPNGRGPGLLRPGRKAKEPLILSAGRLWDEAKNLDAVCRVAPGLPWQVCAAGSADHPDGRKAPLPSIHWLGVLSAAELAAWYARAAIFALPARYEPFGLAALEAALSGCALVLGDISSLREIWGDAALYVPPNDADALWNALHQLIKSPTALAEHQRKSTAKARFYTPQRMAEAYLKAYGELLSPPQAEASVVARANSGSS